MYKYIKRMMDIVIALVSLIVLLPIFIVIAILIKMESRGPVFFMQQRSGVDGKLFWIYKFRSMRENTPNLATDKLVNQDFYITKVGKFIRKTSLDELPQLINLLKGEMSLIGPRPALYNQYELINARHRIGIDKLLPGLTGYAQIMGRDFITDEQKIQFDKYYLENMSITLDLKIFFLTFYKVAKVENVRG